MKRIIALLLCVVMVASVCPVTTFAAATEPNVTLSTNNVLEVEVGQKFLVILGVDSFKASSVAFGFDFDTTLLKATAISTAYCQLKYDEIDPIFGGSIEKTVSPSAVSTVDEMNNSGHVGVVFANANELTYKAASTLVMIQFEALKAGTVKFEMFEDSAGTDGYKNEWTHATTVTIKGDEPSCNHTSTKLVPNADGKTHSVVCTNDACNGYVVRTEDCTGTDDGDHATAVKCACGNTVTAATEHTYTQNRRGTQKTAGDCNTKAVYAVKCDNCDHESTTLTVEGEFGDHAYGTLIRAQEAVHTQDELKPAVAAHYLCKCGKYFTEGKVETTLDALTGEAPEHTEDSKKTETTKEATCTEEGTTVTSIFCKCGKLIETIPGTISAGTGCVAGDPTYTWSDDYSTCMAQVKCKTHNGTVLKEEKVSTTSKVTTEADCVTEKVVTYYADFTADWAEDQSPSVTGNVNSNVHGKHEGFGYDGNTDPINTHAKYCKDCNVTINEAEDCTFGDDHVCDHCGQTETMTVIFMNGEEEWKRTYVDYGDTLGIVGMPLPEAPEGKHFDGWYTEDGGLVAHGMTVTSNLVAYATWADNHVCTHDHYDVTATTHQSVCSCGETIGEAAKHDYTTGEAAYTCICGAKFTGWDGDCYVVDAVIQKTGWTEIEGAWYYLNPETGVRAEGLTRVPYPTDKINGWTYEADAGALAYDSNFIDKDEAWFNFAEDGKFTQTTGIIEFQGATRLLHGGIMGWHPGLVINDSVIYYFIGDLVNGGNIAAEGDTYITRGNGVEGFTEGHIYNFKNGKLSGANGIVDGKYYENSRLMIGNGLTKLGDKYIYVRSNGQIVVNAEYYVPANGLGVVPGMYSFDENGYLINPEMTDKDGIYNENGALYYYENGKIAYNKGLIKLDDGKVIYVRTNGQLAIGDYYVTNVANYKGNDVKSGDKVTFDSNGYMVASKNGIVGGKYYINNQIAYNAGVVEIEAGKYIYVRSNGEVVVDREYWITNVGDTGVVAKMYTFDANGFFTPEFAKDAKNGVVDGYYYENGSVVYGAGLVEYNGGYIYVRSNGMVATGKYWITNTNGLMDNGYYTFGDDGMMIIM